MAINFKNNKKLEAATKSRTIIQKILDVPNEIDKVLSFLQGIKVDTITEKTLNHGVEIDGVLLKDYNAELINPGTTIGKLTIGSSQTAAWTEISRIVSKWDGNEVADIRFNSGGDTVNKDDGQIVFQTSESGSSTMCRMAINPNGNVDIYNDLVVDIINEKTGAAGVTIDGLEIKDTGIKTEHTHINSAYINRYSGTNDTDALYVNHTGYNGGTTYFRDFYIYDGKSAPGIFFDGSSKETDFYGDIKTDTINSHTAGSAVVIKELSIGNRSQLTIASGIITITSGFHTVDTESDAASDDLVTINGGSNGQILIIRADDAGRTVVAKNGTGNLFLESDFSIDNAHKTLTLINSGGSAWLETSRSVNT